MRFVSRSANYTIVARPDSQYEIYETTNGQMIPRMIRKPALFLEFRHGMAHPDENYAAMMHWAGLKSNRTDPERTNSSGQPAPDIYGAVPYQRGVAIQDGVGRIMGVSNPSRPDFNFSLYDTEWLDDDDDRKDAEKALLSSPDLGVWFVKVDALEATPPWPNYNKIRAKKGMTVAQTIADKCADDGYSAAAVLEYERAHANRAAVVEALEAIMNDQMVAVEEAVALEVEIN